MANRSAINSPVHGLSGSGRSSIPLMDTGVDHVVARLMRRFNHMHIELACGFWEVIGSRLIPYLSRRSVITSSMNSLPGHTLACGQGYLFNHVCSNRLAMTSARFCRRSTILNHPVAGSTTMVKAVRETQLYWDYFAFLVIFSLTKFVRTNQVDTYNFPRNLISYLFREMSVCLSLSCQWFVKPTAVTTRTYLLHCAPHTLPVVMLSYAKLCPGFARV